MIISRTPFRISFFGGGTDYPAWYTQHGGTVLATSIDKYCYISCRYLPPFFEHRIRLVYSKIENCQTLDEIAHPSAREILRYLDINRGVEIHHDGDLPARSGMGSSSAFTVGLLHALYALKDQVPSKHQLATESIYIEQDVLKETVGSQDQVSAAYGGFNHIEFHSNGNLSVRPITIPSNRLQDLNAHLMLFYTGITRIASDVADSYVNRLTNKQRQMQIMKDMVQESIAVLDSAQDLSAFGELLHEAWQMKRSLSDQVSTPEVDAMYARAMSAGALGGKLTGAGGGGFLLLFAPPDRHNQIKEQLNALLHVPFKFEFSGSQLIFYDREQDYSAQELARASQPLLAFRELNKLPR